MQLNLLVLSYLASAAVSAVVAVAAWRRRHLVGAFGLALLMIAVVWWLVANALEAASVSRTAKIAWSVVAYPGIELVPVFYVLFVLGLDPPGQTSDAGLGPRCCCSCPRSPSAWRRPTNGTTFSGPR